MSYSSPETWDSRPEKATTEEMDFMPLRYLIWPSLSLCRQLSSSEYLPLNCQTWLGGVYCWKKPTQQGDTEAQKQSCTTAHLPGSSLVSYQYQQFLLFMEIRLSWAGSTMPFLGLWTHSTTPTSKPKQKRGGSRQGRAPGKCSFRQGPHGEFWSCLSFSCIVFQSQEGSFTGGFKTESQNRPVPPCQLPQNKGCSWTGKTQKRNSKLVKYNLES